MAHSTMALTETQLHVGASAKIVYAHAEYPDAYADEPTKSIL